MPKFEEIDDVFRVTFYSRSYRKIETVYTENEIEKSGLNAESEGVNAKNSGLSSGLSLGLISTNKTYLKQNDREILNT